MRDVEDEVNEVLLRDLPVSAFVTTLDEARRLGAMALFGEKYGDAVRVVDVGERDAPYARELCGGTHVAHSAQIGAVTLLSESSVAAGTRRVEGLVGLDAFRFLARERVLLEQVTSAIKATRAEEVPERVNDIVTRLRDAERQLERLRADAVLASAGQLAAGAKDVGGVAVVAAQAPEGTGAKDVRTLAVDVRGRLGDRPGVVVIAASADGKVPLVVALTPAAVDRGLTASDILRAVTAHVGGSGGGRDPQLAQGAGTDASALRGGVRRGGSRGRRRGAVSRGRADRGRRGQRAGGRCRQRPRRAPRLPGDGGAAPAGRQRPRRAGSADRRAGGGRGRRRAAAHARRTRGRGRRCGA